MGNQQVNGGFWILQVQAGAILLGGEIEPIAQTWSNSILCNVSLNPR